MRNPPLVAVAHGSADPRSAAAINGLLAAARSRARARGLAGVMVRGAYLGHALPAVPAVLESLRAPGGGAVVVLPLLLTGAYHSDTDLPAVLGQAQARLPGLRIRYGQPLGPHPGLLPALERRLAEADGGILPDPTATSVVLAAAGSGRPEANAAVARLARQWQRARGWRAVVPAYASAAAPSPGAAVTALRDSGAGRVIVATYLLAPGFFADRVRDQALAAGAHAVSAPLGAIPEVADVIIDRYLRVTSDQEGARDSGNVLKWDDGGCYVATASACHPRGSQPGPAPGQERR
jgi:sirohydrochlorin ferrochelatase